MLEINKIYQGSCLNWLKNIDNESIDCVVTSPPYWALRDYQTEPEIWDGDKNCEHEWGSKIITLTHKSGEKNPGKESWYKDKGASNDKGNQFCSKCNAWKGSLGLEPTFDLYVKHLCDIFDEVKRVLKKEGTCWVVIGDSYFGGGGKAVEQSSKRQSAINTGAYPDYSPNSKLRSQMGKSLCLIPFRFAIEMTNRGWILRNTIIWHKPNCMPASVKDRFTVDFEYVYFFVKSKKYWFEQQFEKYMEPLNRWGGPKIRNSSHKYIEVGEPQLGKFGATSMFRKGRPVRPVEQGRNKRCVWTISTQPFPEAHFAVYPEKLIIPMIEAGCPKYVCKKCGKAKVKIIDNTERVNTRPGNNVCNKKSGKDIDPNKELHKSDLSKYRQQIKYKELGYSDCGCNADFESGIVLDPFMGSGTTGLVAKKLGRNFIGIELNPNYVEIANKRISELPQQLF
jgi:site-specific DNA-methyltransferase (adenine-specific)